MIISDNENSEIIRKISKRKISTIVRRTILAAIDILRHYDLSAIIIDKENQQFDALEFVLNIRDIDRRVPIYIPQDILKNENWKPIKSIGKIISFDNDLLENLISLKQTDN